MIETSIIVAKEFSPQQEQDLKKLQELGQKAQLLQQSKLQTEANFKEAQHAQKTIEGLPADNEIYRLTGHLIFKSTIPDTNTKLIKDKEIMEFQLSKITEQLKTISEQVSELQTKLRSEMNF